MGFFNSVLGIHPKFTPAPEKRPPSIIHQVYHPHNNFTPAHSSGVSNTSHVVISHHHHHSAPRYQPKPVVQPVPIHNETNQKSTESSSPEESNIVPPAIRKAVNPTSQTSVLHNITITPKTPNYTVSQQTITPEQLRQQQNKRAQVVVGKKVTFSLTGPKPGEVDLNPLRVVSAPIIGAYRFGSYLGKVASGQRSITQDAEKVYQGVKKQGVLGTASNIIKGTVEQIASDPFGFIGDTIALDRAGKVAGDTLKNAYVAAGAKYVEPEKIFDGDVLAGEKVMPTSKNIKESIQAFENSNNEVVTASPAKIKGNVAGHSSKSIRGFEDPGIYVAPMGQGSPYFLRVADE